MRPSPRGAKIPFLECLSKKIISVFLNILRFFKNKHSQSSANKTVKSYKKLLTLDVNLFGNWDILTCYLTKHNYHCERSSLNLMCCQIKDEKATKGIRSSLSSSTPLDVLPLKQWEKLLFIETQNLNPTPKPKPKTDTGNLNWKLKPKTRTQNRNM